MRRLIVGLVVVLTLFEVRQANGDWMTIASFQTGGSASYRFESAGMHVDAFTVNGDKMVIGGRLGDHGSGFTGIAFRHGSTSGPLTTDSMTTSDGVFDNWSGMNQAVSFDTDGSPVAAYANAAGNRSYFAYRDSTTGEYTNSVISSTSRDFRYTRLSYGPNGEIAAAFDDTVVYRDQAGTSERDLGVGTLGVVQFDQSGILHAAHVDTGASRSLWYSQRDPLGTWSTELIDAQGTGNMSAYIDLTLTPDGRPVILGNSAGGNLPSLSLHELTQSGFREMCISLNDIFGQDYAGHLNDAGGNKQLVFGPDGTAHIATMSNSEILYLSLDSEWSVIESRRFQANSFYGLGVDSDGIVYLGFDGSGDNTVVPAPSSLACLIGVGVTFGGMQWWKKRRRRTRTTA